MIESTDHFELQLTTYWINERLYWRFYRNTVAGSWKSLLQYCDRISNTIFMLQQRSCPQKPAADALFFRKVTSETVELLSTRVLYASKLRRSTKLLPFVYINPIIIILASCKLFKETIRTIIANDGKFYKISKYKRFRIWRGIWKIF
jgi:hypothetical protein